MASDNEDYDSSDDSIDETTCPLCVEEMDLSDKNFLPCPCGYRVCMWCWHHIRENLNGLCPACRTPYKEDPHAFSAVNTEEIVKKNKERKIKEKLDKKADGTASVKPALVRGGSGQILDRRLLHNYRVVQRNLVYVVGIPGSACTEEILRRPEYFGQYGKIAKVVIHKNHNSSHSSTISAYATFAFKEDAKAAIQALEGAWVDGHMLRASFGTTKYCNNFIRGVPCNNPDCVYLHDLGEEDDRFTKEEIQQQTGHTKVGLVPGKDQLVVTGNGGPSGTGRRPTGETIFPQPVYVQDTSTKRTMLAGSLPQGVATARETESDSKTSDFSYKGEDVDSWGNATDQQRSVMAAPGSFQELKAMYNSTVAANGIEEPRAAIGTAQIADTLDNDSTNTGAKIMTSVSGSRRSEATQQLFAAASFNGVGKCALFPVPISSLAISIWAKILEISSTDLSVNPYSVTSVSFSELLELTLPPVDVSCTTPWPKPLQYYTTLKSDPSSTVNMESFVGGTQQSHSQQQQQQHQQHQQQQQQHQQQQQQQQQVQPQSLQGHQDQYMMQMMMLRQQQLGGQVQQPSSFQQQPSQGNSLSGSNIAALQQIFPGVNMAFGAPNRPPAGRPPLTNNR